VRYSYLIIEELHVKRYPTLVGEALCEKGHFMTVTDDVDGEHSLFTCANCESCMEGQRWFCSECGVDYCLSCFGAHTNGNRGSYLS